MKRLRAFVIGAALTMGVSALASAQPLPYGNWGYTDRDHDRNRGRRVYGYSDHDRRDRGYYDRDDRRGFGRRHRWRDRDDRWRRDHYDRWRYRHRGRDWDRDRRY